MYSRSGPMTDNTNIKMNIKVKIVEEIMQLCEQIYNKW